RKLGVLDHARLDEYRRPVGVDADRKPVDEHLPNAVFDALGRLVVRRQRVPVGGEVKAFVLLLQPKPVLQRAMIVADVHAPGGPYAGQDAVSKHRSIAAWMGSKAGDRDVGVSTETEQGRHEIAKDAGHEKVVQLQEIVAG